MRADSAAEAEAVRRVAASLLSRRSSASPRIRITLPRITTGSARTRRRRTRFNGTRRRGMFPPITRPAAITENRQYKTLQEYQQATKQDAHSLLVDYDAFMNVPRLDGRDVKTVQKLYDAKDFDFRLKPGAPVIDRGIAIPNVTDGFAGRAPDLGAIELGQAPPHYGPRP